MPRNIAVLGVAELQFFLRPRDADEQQPPLLFQLLEILAAPLVRQQPLLQGDDEHDGKFQPLGGVQRHQRDLVGARFPVVGVGDQRSLFQEWLQVRRRPDCRMSNSRAAVSNSSMFASRSWSSSSSDFSSSLAIAGFG